MLFAKRRKRREKEAEEKRKGLKEQKQEAKPTNNYTITGGLELDDLEPGINDKNFIPCKHFGQRQRKKQNPLI